jgi:oligopeptide transport system permease protein
VFILKRLVWMALTLWAVFTVSFLLMHSVPGGPFDSEREMPPEIKANIEQRYNLDQPLYQQYLTQLGGAVRLDFGPSYKLADYSVGEVIAEGLPISASLGLLAMSFAVVLGVTAGTVSALWRRSFLDVALMSIATVGIALPNFIIASICVILFVFVIPIFPAAGWGSVSNLVLPAFCLGAPFAAYIARLTRTGMLDVLGQDYIRTARAKGLSGRVVVVRHALKGALLPVASYLGPATADILTGSLVVEQIFAIPGLGSHFVKAALLRDFPLAMGLVVLYTFLLYSMNLLVDISYTYFDPRVRLE